MNCTGVVCCAENLLFALGLYIKFTNLILGDSSWR